MNVSPKVINSNRFLFAVKEINDDAEMARNMNDNSFSLTIYKK